VATIELISYGDHWISETVVLMGVAVAMLGTPRFNLSPSRRLVGGIRS